MRRVLVLAVMCSLALTGCDSGDGGGGETTNADEGPALAVAGEACAASSECAGNLVCFQESCTNPTDLNTGGNGGGDIQIDPSGEDCGVDSEKLGKEIGEIVGNFALPDQDGQTYELYDNCDGEKKAIWIVLAAGW